MAEDGRLLQAGAGLTPIRVLFVNDHLGLPGEVVHGGTTYLTNTLPAFDPARVRASLVVFRPYHPAAEQLRADGVDVRFFGLSKWDPRALPAMIDRIREGDVDILHVNGKKAHAIGRLAAVLAGLPVILHLHFRYRPRPRGFHRWLARRTTAALAVSRGLGAHAVEAFGMDPELVRVTYSGLDGKRFAEPGPGARERTRAELGLGAAAPMILVSGRLSLDPDKGQLTAIRAFAQLASEHPTATMVLAGDGPARDQCDVLVGSLGLDGRVRLMGQREDLPALLAAADIVLVPSNCADAFPYTALEAMCAGRPVVASRDGGLVEILDDGRRGTLVDAGDVTGFARACARVLTDPASAARVAREASAWARGLTIEGHIDDLTKLYSEILEPVRATPLRGTTRSSP